MFYWGGFLAFGLRIAAWGKQRQQASRRAAQASAPPVIKALGIAMVASGFVLAATGLRWQQTVTAFLTSPPWPANLERWLPYYPFEPFLSLFIIGLGTMLVTKAKPAPNTQELAARGLS